MDLYRLTEPVGGFYKGKTTILPAGLMGVKAEPWPEEHEGTFALIIDEPGSQYDGARAGDLVESQVELAS